MTWGFARDVRVRMEIVSRCIKLAKLSENKFFSESRTSRKYGRCRAAAYALLLETGAPAYVATGFVGMHGSNCRSLEHVSKHPEAVALVRRYIAKYGAPPKFKYVRPQHLADDCRHYDGDENDETDRTTDSSTDRNQARHSARRAGLEVPRV